MRLSDRQVGLLFMLPFLMTAAAFMVWPVLEAVRLAFYSYNPLRPTTCAGWGWRISSASWTTPVLGELSAGPRLDRLEHPPADRARRRPRPLAAPAAAGHRGVPRPPLFPYIVPTVVIALNWRWIFNSEIGIVNHALLSIGIIGENIAWLSTPGMAMLSAILLNVWKYTPFVVICVLARLQTIPTELYDAAKVDGAGPLRRFLDITLPMLKEVLVVVIVFRTIWTFNKFEEIYLLTRGGPGTSTFNLAVYAFEEGMANLRSASRRPRV
jgi:ABC-type sugar transport system permease subunit